MKIDRVCSFLVLLTVLACSFIVAAKIISPSRYPITISYSYPTPDVDKGTREESEVDPFAEKLIKQEDITGEVQESEGDLAIDDGELEVVFPLELNSATEEELMLIPKVGKVTAERIVQYRDYLGGYTNTNQLLNIKGIGTASYEVIGAYVYVTGDDWDLQE